MSQREPSLSPRFRAQIGRALRYWLARTTDFDEAELPQLARERDNIVQAVRYGSALAEWMGDSAELAHRFFPVVERQADFAAWRGVLEQLVRRLPPGAARVRLANHIALLHRLDGRPTTAVAHHQAVLADADAHGLAADAATITYNLGYDYWEINDYRQAWAHAERAAARGAAVPDLPPHFHASVALLKGLVYLHTGRGAQALPLFETAAEQWEAIGRWTYAARAVINMAQAAEATGDLAHGLALYERAEALLERANNRLDRQLVVINRGTNYSRQEKWEKALEAYLAADFDFLRRIGHRRYLAMLATNIGDVALRLGDWDSAESQLHEALRLWRSLEDDVMLANAVGTLGELHLAKRETDRAAHHLDEALALLSRYPDNAWGRELHAVFNTLRGGIA